MRKQPQVQEFDERTIDEENYVLRLFVTGATPNSSRAISNLKEICETYLKSHKNKKLALRELIEMENPKKIFLTSSYK